MTRGVASTASRSWIRCGLWICVALLSAASGAALATDQYSTAPEADPVAELALVDGGTVGDLLDSVGKTVVLIYEPSECFSCTGLLGRWIALGKGQDMTVVVVLTSRPTRQQAASLAFMRIEVAGVLLHGLLDSDASAAHLFDGMTRTRSAVGMVQQMAMLNELTELSSTLHPSPTSQRR